MDDNQIKEIIDLINAKYKKDVPGPVKFVVRRKTKNLEKLDPNEYPESFRKCTIEELMIILKDAYSKKLLRF